MNKENTEMDRIKKEIDKAAKLEKILIAIA
jgi:hypothetical protein